MSRFMTGAECANVTSELAVFFDSRRDLSCGKLLMQRPVDTQELLVALEVVSDPEWKKPTAPLPPRVCTSPSYHMDLRYFTLLGTLPEKRPPASNAILALGSVAAKLPVNIFEANGRLLDDVIASAPQLEIYCAVDNMDEIDRLNKFLEGQKHIRDSSGLPRIETKYLNDKGDPITVGLAFYDALKKLG